MILIQGEPFVFVFPMGSPTPGLSVSVQLSKNGAALFVASGTIVDLGAGYYTYEFTPTDLERVGSIFLRAVAAGEADYSKTFQVRDLINEIKDAFVGVSTDFARKGDVSTAQDDIVKAQRALLDTEVFDVRNAVSRRNRAERS